MNNTVDFQEFKVNCKNDLYQTVLIPEDRDYHGRMSYSHHTVFDVVNDFTVISSYINWLSNEEIINFRDEYDGNILSGLASSGKEYDYFELIINRIGIETTIKLLLENNRLGVCPLAEITNLDTFIIMMSIVDIDEKILRQICLKSTNNIVDHLAAMINSASSIDVANENRINQQ